MTSVATGSAALPHVAVCWPDSGYMEPAMPASRLRTILAATLLAGIVALGASAPAAAAGPVPPSAAFTYSVDGLKATFTDTSTGEPTAWTWDFGDGATSDVQNPVHTFTPGR